jgi:hypothetical protein
LHRLHRSTVFGEMHGRRDEVIVTMKSGDSQLKTTTPLVESHISFRITPERNKSRHCRAVENLAKPIGPSDESVTNEKGRVAALP